MKIVICNHTKSNKTNKYNGINNNIVYYYNIIAFVIIIIIINAITVATHIGIHECLIFEFLLVICKICLDLPQLA